MQVQNSHRTKFKLDQEIARGGEGGIWTVQGKPDLVAKIYHPNQVTPQHEAKVAAMLAAPPTQPKTHTAIAWPTDLLYRQGQFVGFLMPKVQGYEPLINSYHPTLRQQSFPHFDWHYLHRIALNLVIAAEAIHVRGHVIGDVNESNILVNAKTLVTLVDTDSFQVKEQSGKIYRCLVGKAEYTPPQLQGKTFKSLDRTIEDDHFGLAVLIFQLLMEGLHPFSGVLTSQVVPSKSIGRVDLYCLSQGWFPYQQNASATPPPNALSFNILHPDMQIAFVRSFVDGHRDAKQRPTAREWQHILQKAEQALVTCAHNHFYSNHLKHCPWCGSQPTIATVVLPQQKPLPASGSPPVRPARRTSRSGMPWGRLAVGAFIVLMMIQFLAPNFFGVNEVNQTGTSSEPELAATGDVAKEVAQAPEANEDQPKMQLKITKTIDCSPGSDFVADVTIPDGTIIEPGETFVKTWRIRNAGNCEWKSSYAVVFTDGERLGPAKRSLAVISPGEELDISLEMEAPTTPGSYQATWELQDTHNEPFGFLTVMIKVPGADGGGGTDGRTSEITSAPTKFEVGDYVQVAEVNGYTGLNLLEEPNFDSTIIKLLEPGAILEVIDSGSSPWWELRSPFNGQEGWASSFFDGQNFLDPVTIQMPNTIQIGRAVSVAEVEGYTGLNLRRLPTTDSQIVELLPFGALLEVIGGPRDLWWQVQSPNGNEGWVVTFSFEGELNLQDADRAASSGGETSTQPSSDGGGSGSSGYGGGRIAFESERHGNPELYIMNADGSNVQRVTNNQVPDWKSTWSPDGSRLAFESDYDGNYQISLINANGSYFEYLTDSNDSWPTWSPNGNIAFQSNRTNNWELYLISPNGQYFERLTNTRTQELQPAWSPNGAQLAFISNEGNDEHWDIYTMNANGTQRYRLTSHEADDMHPAWCPNGRIAFASYRDGNWEIYIMNADGSRKQRLTNNQADDLQPTCSPDGTRLAFYSNRDGNAEIYVMNSDGSGLINLTNHSANDKWPAWGP